MMENTDYGHRLLTDVLSERARKTPDRILMSLAKTCNIQDGFEDLSYGRLTQAVDRCVHWLEQTVGKHKIEAEDDYKVIFAALPRHDLRGLLLILAAPYTGHQMYWPQPFGEVDNILDSLKKMRCEVFLKPKPCPQLVLDVLERHPLQSLDIPDLDRWLKPEYDPYEGGQGGSLFPIEENAGSRPMGVFQTSGTTAVPKPITLRLSALSVMDMYRRLPDMGEPGHVFEHLVGRRVLTTFGFYQYGGFLFNFVFAVWYDCIPVLAPAIQDWTVDLIASVIRYGDVTACVLYPELCVRYMRSEDPDTLELLRRLKIVIAAGSSTPLWAGNKLLQYTKIGQLFGSTEAAIFPVEEPRRPEEWAYLRMHPQLGGEFRPYLDQYRQLVVVRTPSLEDWQGAFKNFPELDEWVTGDLLEPHPSDPGLWLPAGRVVDLFKCPDGRVFNPSPIEYQLGEDPAVQLAMIYGITTGGKLLLLLTPWDPLPEDGHSMHEFIDRIWPMVERTFEEKSPSWVCDMLDCGTVFVTPKEKPIQRTGGKWNINRKKTRKLHGKTLEDMFGSITLSL